MATAIPFRSAGLLLNSTNRHLKRTATAGIFISYGRHDNRYAAGRLYDALTQRFPGNQIFIGVDDIEPGLNFLKVIQDKVASSDAMLVIGPNWLSAMDGHGKRRLDHPTDLVRQGSKPVSIETSRVIPVLVCDRDPRPAALVSESPGLLWWRPRGSSMFPSVLGEGSVAAWRVGDGELPAFGRNPGQSAAWSSFAS